MTLAIKLFITLATGWAVMLVFFVAGSFALPSYPQAVPNMLVALAVGDLALHVWRWIETKWVK